MNEPLMNIKEAADLFGVHRETMAGWLNDPRRGFVVVLDEHKVRKVTRVSVEAVYGRVKGRKL